MFVVAIKMTTNKLPNLPLILVIAVMFLLPMHAHIMEIILEEDSPAIASSKTGVTIDGFDENGGNGGGLSGCSVEFQVMKKLPGRCVRLGGKNGGRGCVSGNHLVPFHPDCL